MQTGITSYDAFWTKSLQEGVFEVASAATVATPFNGDLSAAASAATAGKSDGIEIIILRKNRFRKRNTGKQPVVTGTSRSDLKSLLDNYFAMSPSFAEAQGYKQGNVIEVKVGSQSIKGPVYLQPGVADKTIAAALGYGRTSAGKTANNVGFNAYKMATLKNGTIHYYATDVHFK